MNSYHNQEALDDGNPGDISTYIGQSLQHQIHIWHHNKGGELIPYRKLTVQQALTIIKYGTPHDINVVDVDNNNVSPYIGKFTRVFSWGGNYMPVLLKQLVVPKIIKKEVDDYISLYDLAGLRDLIWYLIARLQIFYTQKVTFGDITGKEHMGILRKSQEDYLAIQRLVQYVLDSTTGKITTPLSISIKQGRLSHTITEHWQIGFIMEGFIQMFLTENGRLLPNWKEKLASYDANYAIKNDFEHIHRNFAIAYIEFLKLQGIVSSEKITAAYLNPVVELLNISQYPFIKDGYALTPKHIKSVLKTVDYTLPLE